MRQVLVGTLGYHNLRDYSLGPKLLPQLRAIDWPPGVMVDELNWGPIAIVQDFEARSIPYDRVVILTATQRGRSSGTLTLFHWVGTLPSADEIQDRISEAVTGVISLDNLLIIGEYFNIWPEEVFIIDVEPGLQEAGDTFTPTVAKMIPAILDIVRQTATADIDTLPSLQALKGASLRLTTNISEN
jgi:hypothetical protein